MMRRWETLTALAAVVCALVGSMHFALHAGFTYGAIALLGVVALSRLHAALAKRGSAESDAAARARRIREQRKQR